MFHLSRCVPRRIAASPLFRALRSRLLIALLGLLGLLALPAPVAPIPEAAAAGVSDKALEAFVHAAGGDEDEVETAGPLDPGWAAPLDEGEEDGEFRDWRRETRRALQASGEAFLAALEAAAERASGGASGTRAGAAGPADATSAPTLRLDFPAEHLPVRIGIVMFVRPAPNEPIVAATLAALRRTFGPSNVTVKAYALEELSRAIENREVDAFLSSSGFYVRMKEKGARALATAVSGSYPDPNHNDGSSFVVNAARTDLKDIPNLKGGTLVTSRPTAFTGLQLPLHVIRNAGFDPERFFGRIRFLGDGEHMKSALPMILAGEADVAFLRLCYLEEWLREHPEDRGRLRVLHRLDSAASPEPCARSTPLYSSWTFATTPATAPQVSRLIARALLTMPPAGPLRLHWGVATDYTGVDAIFRDLQIGDYAYLRDWTVRRILAEYGEYVLIALLLIAGLVLHSIRVTKLVRERTDHLKRALERQTELQRKAQAAAAHIERLGKISAVGQLCTIFAHEMRQPLGALSLYVMGLKKLLASGHADAERAAAVMDRISAQLERADGIVSRVRNYARSESLPQEPVELCETVRKAIAELSTLGRWQARIEFTGKPVRILAEPMEIELVAINLIRNALEATEGCSAGLVTASVCTHGNTAELTVLNNGPEVPLEVLTRLSSSESAPSEKTQGLGLGLSIVRSILERTGGRLRFTALEGGGLAAVVELPTLERTMRHRTREAAASSAPDAESAGAIERMNANEADAGVRTGKEDERERAAEQKRKQEKEER